MVISLCKSYRYRWLTLFFVSCHRRYKVLDRLPLELLKRYEKWKDIVRISGPAGVRPIKGFHDERPQGEWEGHRSSRLNAPYRVIYKVED
jgi:hypothetical protein